MTSLILCIPSKGRLKEQTEEFFARAGFPIEPLGGARGYLARIARLPEIEVRLMSAGEIAKAIGAPDAAEIVFKICEHLAANPGRGVAKKPGKTALDATFSAS